MYHLNYVELIRLSSPSINAYHLLEEPLKTKGGSLVVRSLTCFLYYDLLEQYTKVECNFCFVVRLFSLQQSQAHKSIIEYHELKQFSEDIRIKHKGYIYEMMHAFLNIFLISKIW